MAIGIDLPAAVYHALAGILIGNIDGYELLRKLVASIKAVTRAVCCGVTWVLSTVRSAGRRAVYVVLEAAGAASVIEASCLRKLGSLVRKGAKLAVCAMLSATEKVVGFVDGFRRGDYLKHEDGSQARNLRRPPNSKKHRPVRV